MHKQSYGQGKRANSLAHGHVQSTQDPSISSFGKIISHTQTPEEQQGSSNCSADPTQTAEEQQDSSN